jgi:hypothetical protein
VFFSLEKETLAQTPPKGGKEKNSSLCLSFWPIHPHDHRCQMMGPICKITPRYFSQRATGNEHMTNIAPITPTSGKPGGKGHWYRGVFFQKYQGQHL